MVCVGSLRRALLVLLAVAGWSASTAASAADVRVGVLAFRSVPHTLEQWSPLAEYLQAKLPGSTVRIVPLIVDGVEGAVMARGVDFLLVNPEQYVSLAARHRLAAIATLVPLAGSRPVSRFGGVIFARGDRADLQEPADIVGRRVAIASEKSFAGYLVQKAALLDRGIDFDRVEALIATGMPQDRVIGAVIAGEADFGFVRTGLIESMIREGKLVPDALKVIGNDPAIDFPQRLSTPLYPEWPFATLPHVADETVKAVALALLNLRADEPAAVAARVHGFAPPGDYATIEALLLRLRVHPERLNLFGPAEVLSKYPLQLLGVALLVVLLAIAAAVRLRAQNRALAATLDQMRRLEQREELLDGLGEGVYGVDAAGRCTFVNPAALNLLGFRADELVGRDQHALFHHHYPDGRPYPAAECPVRRTVTDGERREGEEVFYRRDGTSFPVRFAARAICRDGVVSGAVVVFQDIAAEKAAQARIRELAMHDPLTGLPNRRELWERIGIELARAARDGTMLAVLFIDLDGFKEINDRHGHEVGDAVLVAVSRRLAESLRAVDMVGRLGGDEFVTVLTGLRGMDAGATIAQKLLGVVSAPFTVAESTLVSLTASIGIANYPDHGADAATLVHRADVAMYEAKRAG
jgi:diguanylate cyclase (GGDEF)-like protein/PAS domain S-box-containing protein